MTAVVNVPRGNGYLDPDWLTRCLQSSYPGVQVSSARPDGGSSGTTDRVRLAVKYAAEEGPRTLFVKKQGSLPHRCVVSATGMLCNEAKFYAEAGEVQIDMPAAYAIGTDRPRLNSLLLLEDVAGSGARTNVSTSPLSVEECARGLAGLAGLHAKYWPGNGHDGELSWLPPSMGGPWWWATVRSGTALGVPRARKAGIALAPGADSSTLVTKRWRAHCRRCATAPVRTVVHGDAHVGNTYVRPEGAVGFLDWQIVGRGAWFFDVPYFLVGAISVEDRRAEERGLLAHYLAQLKDRGPAAPSLSEAWAEHREASVYGLGMWLCTLGYGESYQAADICLAYVERYSRAIADHQH